MLTPTALVTGASRGIGLEVARGLADAGHEVVLVCRDGPDAAGALAQVSNAASGPSPVLVAADLSRQSEVRRLASVIRQRWPQLGLLIHNAAIISRTPVLTEDGVDLQFAVNHLAVYLLTHELISGMVQVPGSRIVVTASQVERSGVIDFEDLNRHRAYDHSAAYAQSKLANVLFSYQLASRLPAGPTVNCVHPGVIRTRLLNTLMGEEESTGLLARGRAAVAGTLRRLGLRPPAADWALPAEAGARTTLHLASDPALVGVTGRYFSDGREAESSPRSHDRELQRRLWEESARLVGVHPDWP